MIERTVFGNAAPETTESADWPYLREAQAQTRAEPGADFAVALDVGEKNDIHPTNKQAVGHRLQLGADRGSCRRSRGGDGLFESDRAGNGVAQGLCPGRQAFQARDRHPL